MAILFTNPTTGLQHTSGILPFNADFTWMGWFTPVTDNPTGGAYRNYWVLHDSGYNNYIEIASDVNTGSIDVYGFDGGNFTSKVDAYNTILLDNAYNVCITYDISATTLRYYINGTLVWTYLTADFTGLTTTNEKIGYDAFSAHTNFATQNARAWAGQVLIADQIAVEISSNIAIYTTGLFYDTPLTDATDLADVSGNGKDWVNIAGAGADYITNQVNFITGSANNSFANALTIPSLPYKLVQNAKLVSTAADLFYSIDALDAHNVIGAWAYSSNGTYNPNLEPYFSDENDLLGIGNRRVPIQFPVDGGDSYYLKVHAFGGNPTTAVVFLQIDYIGNEAIAIGDLADPDDTDGFPISVVRQNSSELYNNVITFRKPFVAGEQGDALTSGSVLMINAFDGGKTPFAYSAELIETTNIITLPTNDKFVRSSNGRNSFFLVNSVISGATAYEISNVGVVGDNWSLGAIDIGTPGTNGAIAGNNDATILYYTDDGNEIKRWDLIGNIGLTDFLPAVANHKITDILILSDDSIIIMYFKNTVTRDLIIKRYDADSTLLNTYSLGSDFTVVAPRLSYSTNDPTTFWAWTHSLSDPGLMNLREITVSDGSEATNIPWIEFENGSSQENITPVPRARYGGSFSCPFFQIRNSFVPPPMNPLSGIYKIIPWSRKLADTLYTSLDPVETEDVQIPRPFGKGPPLGQ